MDDDERPTSPVKLEGLSPLRIVLFVSLMVLTIVGVDTARYQLLEINVTVLPWLYHAGLFFFVLTALAVLLSWAMRQRLTYREPSWEFREREMSPSEYESMVREYTSSYLHLATSLDWPALSLSIISLVVGLAGPVVIASLSIYSLQAAPLIFGLSLLIYGLALSRFAYRAIPTAAGSEFATVGPRQLRAALRLLSENPAVSWWGVRVRIGHSEGYFVMRDVTPVGRIECLEGAGWVEIVMRVNRPVGARVVLQGVDEPVEMTDESDPARALNEALVRAVSTYVSWLDDTTALEDLLDDLGIRVSD